jgi:hypothetical protein
MQTFTGGGDLQRASAKFVKKHALVIDFSRTHATSRWEVGIFVVEVLKPCGIHSRLRIIHVLLDGLFILNDLVSLYQVGVNPTFAACGGTRVRTASPRETFFEEVR